MNRNKSLGIWVIHKKSRIAAFAATVFVLLVVANLVWQAVAPTLSETVGAAIAAPIGFALGGLSLVVAFGLFAAVRAIRGA
jgi:F0F1-type ATP synthase membrane subunit a